jgi:hypothetical protein
MGRACTVCGHPERAAIDVALGRNEPYRAIARHFGLDRRSVERHAHNHVAEEVAEAVASERESRSAALVQVVEERTEAALDVRSEVEKLFGHLRRLADACERELVDPEHPDRFLLVGNGENAVARLAAASVLLKTSAALQRGITLLGKLLATLPAGTTGEELDLASCSLDELRQLAAGAAAGGARGGDPAAAARRC